MGKVKLSVDVEDGKGVYKANWDSPTNVDLSVAVTQIELLKNEMLGKLKKSEVKWDKSSEELNKE